MIFCSLQPADGIIYTAYSWLNFTAYTGYNNHSLPVAGFFQPAGGTFYTAYSWFNFTAYTGQDLYVLLRAGFVQPTVGSKTAHSWQDYSPLVAEKQPTRGFASVTNSLIIKELDPVFAYK